MTATLDGDLLLKPEERRSFYESLVRDIDEALSEEKEWNPDLHPREPAGSPEGGRFTSGGGGGGDTGADAPSVTYALVADASEAYDTMAGGGGAEIEPDLLQDTYDHFLANPSVNLQRMQVSGEPNLFARHLREIGRGSMPQIPEDAEGFKKYTDFLETKGIRYTYEDIDPRRLIATQNNLDSVTVAGITKYLSDHGGKLKETGGTLVTSKEYAIVDGHHRWGALASYALLHPEEHVSVRILHSNADIDTMLAVSREFDRIHGIASEEFGAPMTGAGSRAKEAAPRGLSDAKDGTPEGVYTKEIEQYVRDAKKKPNAILKAVVGLLSALGIKTKEWNPDLHPRGEGGLFTESGSGGPSHTADVVMVVEGTSKSTREMIAKAVRRAKDYIRPDDKPILVDTMLMKFNPRDLGITQSSDLVSHITLNSMVFESSIVDPVAVQAELGKSGWTSTGAPDHAVIHELGHALAGGSVAERREQGSWKILYGENQYIGERMAAKVSEYATRSPAEFVAETFAGLVHGQKYDAEVMQAYRTLGGREKVKKAKAWVEKFNEHHDELGRFSSGDGGGGRPVELSEDQQQAVDDYIANGHGFMGWIIPVNSWSEQEPEANAVLRSVIRESAMQAERKYEFSLEGSMKEAVVQGLADTIAANQDVDWHTLFGPTLEGEPTEEQKHDMAIVVAQGFVNAWAQSSSDSSELSLALQSAAQDLFGASSNQGFDEQLQSIHISDLVDYQAHIVAQAVYDRTQEYLRVNNISELVVHRGMSWYDKGEAEKMMSDSGMKVVSHGDVVNYYGAEIEVESNPLSSYSLGVVSASSFASKGEGAGGLMLHAVIPAEHIFSLPSTGIGCLNEDEVVVLGRNGTKVLAEGYVVKIEW